jgi:HD superfamily phosphodiesterase
MSGYTKIGFSDSGKGCVIMDFCKGRVTKLLVDYFGDDFKRITHALEVLKYSEKLMEHTMRWDYDIVVASVLLHDIGIKQSEKVLGSNYREAQEKYGPAIAEKLLKGINFPPEKISMVCEIIGNQYSGSKYDYVELKILQEADKMVHRQEGG